MPELTVVRSRSRRKAAAHDEARGSLPPSRPLSHKAHALCQAMSVRPRAWLLTYACLVVMTYASTALVGGSDWTGGAVPWMVLDALLIRAMARGSDLATAVSLALALASLGLMLAQPAGLVQVGNGSGSTWALFLALAMAQSASLIGLLLSRAEEGGTGSERPLIGHARNS